MRGGTRRTGCSRAGALLAALAFVSAVAGAAAPAPAQEGPAGTDSVAVDAELRRALRELRQGKDVDANLERVRGAIGKAKDRGATALAIGVELLRAGLYEAAQGIFEIARAARPEDGACAQMLGLSFVMQDRYAEGLAPLLAAEKLLPAGPHPYLRQYESMALVGLQRSDEAVAHAKQAIDEGKEWNGRLASGEAAIDLLDLELNLAAIYERARREGEALALLDRLPFEKLNKKEQAKATFARARLLAGKGDDDGALAAFRRYSELAPDAAEGWYQYGLFHVARNEPAKARAPLEKAVALDAGHEGAHINLARVLLRLGEVDAGKRMMERWKEIRAARIASEVRILNVRNELIERARASGR